MKLYLIRHGETELTIQKKYCGFSNPLLNEIGRISAQSLAGTLGKIEFDKIFSSDLSRAFETAQIVFPDKEIILSDVFREMNFGIFDGFDYKYLSQTYPELYQNWIYNPSGESIPCAENFNDFKARIKNALLNLLSESDSNNVALVTHSGPIRIMICEALASNNEIDQSYSTADVWKIKCDPCGFSVINFNQKIMKIEGVNINTHLYRKESIVEKS